MPYHVHGEAWPSAPMGMVLCAPPAPRLNAARPRLDRHPAYAQPWYPAYVPPAVYAGWQPPAYPYAPQPYWGSAYGPEGPVAPAGPAAAYAAPPPAFASAAAHAHGYVAHPAPYGMPYASASDAPPAHQPLQHGGGAPHEPIERTPSPPPEATAVPLAAFGAEAIWRASAALVGLGPGARAEEEQKRTSLGTTTSRSSTPSRSSEALATSPSSSECSLEPFTPSRAQVSSASSVPSTPSLPSVSPKAEKPSLDASMESLRIDTDPPAMRMDDGPRSTALHRLVREMGQNPRAFPSLETPAVHSERPRSALRRPRTPSKHTPLGGEVSPAFRHFVHQVLAQTLLSPTALVLALYYVQLLPVAIGTDAETALGLLGQPTSTTPFKLLTLGLMVANKFLDDNTFLNKTWHEVTGIPLAELNKLESYFLCRTQFHLSLSDAAWRQHLVRLREAELSSGAERSDSALLVETLDTLLAESPLR